MNLDAHLVQLGDELRYGKTGLDVDLAIVTRDRKHQLTPHQVEALIRRFAHRILPRVFPRWAAPSARVDADETLPPLRSSVTFFVAPPSW